MPGRFHLERRRGLPVCDQPVSMPYEGIIAFVYGRNISGWIARSGCTTIAARKRRRICHGHNRNERPCRTIALSEPVRLSGSPISAAAAMRREAILFDIVFHYYA